MEIGLNAITIAKNTGKFDAKMQVVSLYFFFNYLGSFVLRFLNFTGVIVDNTECDERKRPENSTKCRAEECTTTRHVNYGPKSFYNSSQHKWMIGKWTKVFKEFVIVRFLSCKKKKMAPDVWGKILEEIYLLCADY